MGRDGHRNSPAALSLLMLLIVSQLSAIISPPNPLFPKLLEIKSIFFNFILFFPGMITTLHLENH